uniref:Uncharacterized protein n=1 Tax=Aegilops tauschii subsp. strangulata TaxID=200361 RepID=A0A453H5E7_AEGTS
HKPTSNALPRRQREEHRRGESTRPPHSPGKLFIQLNSSAYFVSSSLTSLLDLRVNGPRSIIHKSQYNNLVEERKRDASCS